jgi:uncharacterized protein (TIGR03382 family)
MQVATNIVASALLAATVGAAASAAIPTVGISISSSGGGSASGSPTGSAVEGSPNQYAYGTQLFSAGKFFSSYAMNAVDTSATDRMIFGGLVTVINTASAAQEFTIDLTASTVARGPASLVGGSMSGTVAANGDGATFSMGGSTAGWTGLINSGGSSAVAGTMFAAPIAIDVSPFLAVPIAAQSFGMPIPSLPSGAMGDSVGIRLNFVLGAGDRVDLTTVYVVQASSSIPAPGSLCLLAAAALGCRRRRR